MPASSLIFVVIVAIWAAYLLQHWVRRRENAAAARSVEGFTEAMRVLEKRPVPPRADLDLPRPHSYAVTPARVACPTVDVKRAVPAGVRHRSPLVAGRRSATDPVEAPTMSPAPAHSHAHTSSHPSYHASRPESDGAARRPSRARRRVRGALLLLALLWVPVSVVLAVLHILLWVSVPLAALTVLAVVVWLRVEARADRARASGQTTRRADPAVLSSEVTQVIRQPQRYAAGAPGSVTEDRDRHAPSPAEAAPAPADAATAGPEPATAAAPEPATAAGDRAAGARSAAYETVFDIQALEKPARPPAEPAPGTWSPVPVPTPTYAMKAKAEPRLTANGIPADVFDTPEFAEEAEELDERALFARRAVSQ